MNLHRTRTIAAASTFDLPSLYRELTGRLTTVGQILANFQVDAETKRRFSSQAGIRSAKAIRTLYGTEPVGIWQYAGAPRRTSRGILPAKPKWRKKTKGYRAEHIPAVVAVLATYHGTRHLFA